MSDFDFRHWSHRAADWAADYHETLRTRPVRAQTEPGAIDLAGGLAGRLQGRVGASICKLDARVFHVGLIRGPSTSQHCQHHIGRYSRDQVLESVSADRVAEKSVYLTVELLADLR